MRSIMITGDHPTTAMAIAAELGIVQKGEPALTLIDQLLAERVELRVHDPEAIANVRRIYGDRLTYCDRPYGALEGADGLVLVTEWQEFRNPDFEVMKRLLSRPVIFDGRNIYDHDRMKALGFTYYGIGRGHRP